MKLFHTFTFLTLITTSFSYCYNFLDITQHGYEQYQDIIINNTVVKPATHNHKDCDTRHQIIKQILDKYERPFTILDIGASQGYYSFRTAYDYKDAVCVMIEGNNPSYPLIGTQLLDLCKTNNLDNVVLLNKMIVLENLQRLSECEHFDVVLALNIIHWFPNQWQQITNAILNMGDNIIIETPPQEAATDKKSNEIRKAIEQYLLTKNTTVLGKVPRHTSSNAFSTIYLVESNKQLLIRKTWLKPILKTKALMIVSNFKEKKLIKQVEWPPNTYETTTWIPGINLITFKMYHGTYPDSQTTKESIKKLTNVNHNDWTVNNMIIQGKTIQMIDLNDPTHGPGGPGGGRKCTERVLSTHLKFLEIIDPKEVEWYFWNTIVKTR